jgi:DNA-binding MarR family transcriptional regulator/GNAT superfamily N-acetyltransferase
MAQLQDYGGLLLGSRLKRVSEALYLGVDSVYRAHGVEVTSRAFPILFLLRDDGPLSVTELATRLGQAHPGVIRLAAKLVEAGLVTEKRHPRDERRRMLRLGPKGRALMERLVPVWTAIRGAVDELVAGADFLAGLGALEQELGQRDFAARIGEQLAPATGAGPPEATPEVEIIPYAARYRRDFARLNFEWLEHYFSVEPVDERVLTQPERHILEPGGHIFLARIGKEIVGTVALLRRPRGQFELSKMAVTTSRRGLGIGRLLLRRAIACYLTLGARGLYLETNRKLTPAIRLYEANDFHHAPRPKGPIHYRRSNVYMVWRGAA